MNDEGIKLLGAFVDLAVKVETIWPTNSSPSPWRCHYCGDTARTPDKMRHRQGCLVAHAQDYLRHVNQVNKKDGLNEHD